MPSGNGLRAELRSLLQRGAGLQLTDDEFNTLALRAFRHQFTHNLPYRRYCERRGRTPDTCTHWTDVPAVPTAAFKEVELVAGSAAAAVLSFRTSGTTRGSEKRGVHYILDPSLYDVSLTASFDHYVLRGDKSIRMLSLVPTSAEQPDSSLGYMITHLLRERGAAGSAVFASVAGGLQVDNLDDALAAAETAGVAVCLLGTALAYVHWLEHSAERFRLPHGSRLMDTGGFKGVQREVTPEELRAHYAERFGIAADMCINEYGMTEMCSQYYDTALSTDERGAVVAVKRGPPWLRARIVDPDTLAPVRQGEVGILQHFDLANLDSVSAIQTEDLAREVEGGFVLLGRTAGAPPRGCSIAMDILLSDAHSR